MIWLLIYLQRIKKHHSRPGMQKKKEAVNNYGEKHKMKNI